MDEPPPARAAAILRALAPLLTGLALLGLWEGLVRWREVPVYLLPPPSLVLTTLIADWDGLSRALWVTLSVTGAAFAAAGIGGVLLAVLFAQSPTLERVLFPYAVILQVTPIIAIAPLIIIWTGDDQFLSLLICAWIVAFFPVLSNTALGLRACESQLLDLFRLYGASRWQCLWLLRLPAALPYMLGGLRIAGGLALIGAVVAEFVAASGGGESGLAYRILESGYRLNIPRMFAALLLISLTGIAIHLALSAISWLLLHRWHDSARRGE